MNEYDQRKKHLESLIKKEAQHLRRAGAKAYCSSIKYNYYRLKLFFMVLLKKRYYN